MAKYRNFNGYGFTADKTFHYKDDAENCAKGHRQGKGKARITKEAKGYTVWYRR
jgi:hypothetical protein